MTATLFQRIREHAEKEPEKVAIAFKEDSLTYAQLVKKSSEIGAWLNEQGIKAGDRICFSAVSRPETVATYLGCQCIGAVSVFLDKSAIPENMSKIYQASEAKLLLTDKPMKEFGKDCNIFSLRKVYSISNGSCDPVTVSENDLSEILFTSGTTGIPKGVMLSYKAVYNILLNTVEGCGYNEKTIMLLPLPLNHSFALRVLRAILYTGGTTILQNGFTFAKEVENNIETFHCNSIAVVPTSYEVMKNQMQDAFKRVLSNLTSFEFGAGSLSISQRKDITALFPDAKIWNVWGSSESGGAIFCNVTEVSKNEKIIGSLGKPLQGKIEAAFLSEDAPLHDKTINGHLSDWFLKTTDAAHPGRMALRGDMQMSGYWKDANNTISTLIDGWLITGDMAYQDGSGNIFMLGRADDIINMGGEKVSPLEIENIAGQYEQIRDCACIGAADDLLGQIPVLFVVTGMGYDETDFQKWLSTKIERTKLPQKILRIDSIPRNRMQKINRKELHKLWENQDILALMNPVVDAILSRRSIRKFTDQEIPEEMLNIILKCGYHAPNGHNLQSWRFTVLTSSEDIDKLKAAINTAAKLKKISVYGFENPKVLILISNDNRNPNGCQDASCAAENIMLAAQSFGIGSVWLNALVQLKNENPVKKVLDAFKIPENHIVWASIALGWPAGNSIKLPRKTDVIFRNNS